MRLFTATLARPGEHPTDAPRMCAAPLMVEVAQGHHVACLRRPVGGDPGPLSVPG